jgi:hypothetical protein
MSSYTHSESAIPKINRSVGNSPARSTDIRNYVLFLSAAPISPVKRGATFALPGLRSARHVLRGFTAPIRCVEEVGVEDPGAGQPAPDLGGDVPASGDGRRFADGADLLVDPFDSLASRVL